jgi:hypothetical protein
MPTIGVRKMVYKTLLNHVIGLSICSSVPIYAVSKYGLLPTEGNIGMLVQLFFGVFMSGALMLGGIGGLRATFLIFGYLSRNEDFNQASILDNIKFLMFSNLEVCISIIGLYFSGLNLSFKV